MKGIEFPLLDFSLLIFTLHKRIFNQAFFLFNYPNLKSAINFSSLEPPRFHQIEKISINVYKLYDKNRITFDALKVYNQRYK